MLSDSHYCRAVTISTSRIHPSPHTRTSRQTRRPHCGGGPLNYSQHRRATVVEVEDSVRRSGRDDSAGKEATTCLGRLLRPAATTVEPILPRAPPGEKRTATGAVTYTETHVTRVFSRKLR
ncbi:hypothetical protein PoB_006718600 [Plakobranchus ocellatus]|uniref:Uncharacterized protein n=1 Tax=Plakobranchus ocellatus TaxID=259542 RepID=A0AAV4D9R9_9GAST|nr:hypothetical protein PoB_006718600 [Plakobranchus ocellatus]